MVVTVEEVQALVCLQLGKRKVSSDDRLMEDLGAESADIVNIVAAAEDKFDVSFNEADIAAVRTVKDVYQMINASGGQKPF